MNVLVADKFEDVGIQKLKAGGFAVQCKPGLNGLALADALIGTKSEVLVVRSTKVPADVIEKAPNLRLIVRAGSGVDTIDVGAATKKGVRVCNCPGQNSVAVAELTIGLMIALDRRIVDETADLRHRTWNKKEYSKARGLKGRTLGIIGMGRIGAEVAKRAAAFDMPIIYTDVVPRPDVEKAYHARRLPMDVLLREADFVTIHAPGGKETHHLIGAAQIALMKPTAFLLNCSRGGVVDETALSEAIKANKLGGAALDVYEIEPGANDTEFADPVVQTPHVYGTHHVGASTEQAQLAVAEETVRIVKAFRDEGKLLNCVNG